MVVAPSETSGLPFLRVQFFKRSHYQNNAELDENELFTNYKKGA